MVQIINNIIKEMTISAPWEVPFPEKDTQISFDEFKASIQ